MATDLEGVTAEDCLRLLKARRSIRRYRPQPVPREMIAQLLEAGRCAPSATNRQPWRFIVVEDQAIRAQVARHAGVAIVRWTHAEEAPLLIALCGDTRNPALRAFLHEDVGIAGAQIMLQATALGLGTCWLGGIDKEAIGAVLGLPAHIEVIALLTVGFPDEDPEPRSRKPLGEVAFWNVYGNVDPEDDVSPGEASGGWLVRLLRKLRIRYRS
jgi:nitroreductase